MFSPETYAILYTKIKLLSNYMTSGLKYKGSLTSDTPISGTSNGDYYVIKYDGTLTSASKTVEDGDFVIWNSNTNKWDLLKGGISGDSNKRLDLVSNKTVGAILSGTHVNNTAIELWEMALLDKLPPLITLTGDLNKTMFYEKGVNKQVKVNVKVEKKTDNIGSVVYSSTPNNSSFSGSQAITDTSLFTNAKTITIKDTQEFKVVAKDIENRASSATLKYEFVYPMYLACLDTGEVADVTESLIKDSEGCKKILSNKSTVTTTINTTTDKYVCFCYPSSYGNLKTIKDKAFGIDMITGYNKGTVNMTCADGNTVSYTFYLAKLYSTYNNKVYEFAF